MGISSNVKIEWHQKKNKGSCKKQANAEFNFSINEWLDTK
jgi:hypothetical protein